MSISDLPGEAPAGGGGLGAVSDIFGGLSSIASGVASGASGYASYLGAQGQATADQYAALADQYKAEGAEFEQQNYELAAKLAGQNADYTVLSTAIQQHQDDRQIYQSLSNTQAQTAGAGLKESGSAVDILSDSASQGALAKQVLGEQGYITEAGYEEQKQSYLNMSSAANVAIEAANTAAQGEQQQAATERQVATADLAAGAANAAANTAKGVMGVVQGVASLAPLLLLA